MTIPFSISQDNNNNPTKEILASSGIFHGEVYAQNPYAPDIPNSNIANTGINTTTTITTSTQPPENFLLPINLSSLSSEVDDMLVFNDYIHYSTGAMFGTTAQIKRFNPRSFLEQSIVSFNIYNLEHKAVNPR